MPHRLNRQIVSCAASIIFVSGLFSPALAGGDGRIVDAAQFALTLDNDDPSPGLRWGEPRKIQQVVVEWGDKQPTLAADSVHVQYWRQTWDGHADPIVGETGTGGEGWAAVDDWTNGRWQDAQTQVKTEGNTWTFTFAPTGPAEFEQFKGEGVSYRKTLKIRLKSSGAAYDLTPNARADRRGLSTAERAGPPGGTERADDSH